VEEGGTLTTVALTSVQVLALAAAGVALGEWITRRFALLRRLSIPPSITGGLGFALVALALHAGGIDVKPDPALRDIFQLVCFTVIGLNGSLAVLRRGGVQVLMLLALASTGAVFQNALGIGLAKLFGLHPLIGVLSGSVALAGGPATSLAFGATFEQAGIPAATTIALASATFGITVSGLIAGFAGARLIQARGLKSGPLEPGTAAGTRAGASSMMTHIVVLAVSMGLGSLVSAAIERAGVVLPAYIGAMIVAALVRNLDDRLHLFGICEQRLDGIFSIGLPLFIVMAMLTLRLWELAALAGPLAFMLIAQTALAWLMTVTLIFRAMGRDYDSAVASAGFCGFMLGVTANAIASMNELTSRFGPSPRAFLAVPVVGAFLIDFTNALIITITANLLK
jgi:ESS family glutamate:Na+ symporter